MPSNRHDLLVSEVAPCEVCHTFNTLTVVCIFLCCWNILAEFSHKLANSILSKMFIFVPNRIAFLVSSIIGCLPQVVTFLSEVTNVIFVRSNEAKFINCPIRVKKLWHKSCYNWIVTFLVILSHFILCFEQVGNSSFIVKCKTQGFLGHVINVLWSLPTEVISDVKYDFILLRPWTSIWI